jgi:hypothetical protein
MQDLCKISDRSAIMQQNGGWSKIAVSHNYNFAATKTAVQDFKEKKNYFL